MREIKFRAWDQTEKRFWHFTLQDILERRMAYRGSWDEKIMHGTKTQYSGRKDVDGVEIFEGDLIELEDFDGKYRCIVRFGVYGQDGSGGEYKPDEVLGFYIEALPNQLDRFGYSIPEEFQVTASIVISERLKPRVVDNIFENPGLLEQLNKE